jgi:hypothetical protein
MSDLKKDITICLHCGNSWDVVKNQMSLLKPLENKYNIFWNLRIERNPGSYDSYSQMVNEAIAASPTETMVFLNDRVIPKTHEVEHMLDLLDKGYAAASKYSVGYIAYTKELIREIGWWDERYTGGGFEDDDFVLKLRLHNLAYYESEEGEYDQSWKSPLRPDGGDKCAKSEPHFRSKWKQDHESIIRVIPDEIYEKYDDSLGERRPDISSSWKEWSHSQIGIMFAERMITHRGGESRTHHFRYPNGHEFRKVLSEV